MTLITKRNVEFVERFYRDVTTALASGELAYEVLLDGRSLRTPMRKSLQLPGTSLANAIADEWRSQGEKIDAETMPLTRIAAAAVDRVADDRESYIDQIAAYGGTDLVCYRAQAPAELVIRQSRAWQPLLDWARDTFGSELVVTDGLLPIEQPPESLAQLRVAVAEHDNYELAALGVATSASGSIVVALALSKGHLDADTAFEVGQLDESYQVELWGEEADAQARRDILHADTECAASFLKLVRKD